MTGDLVDFFFFFFSPPRQVYLKILLQVWCARSGLRMCGGQRLNGRLPCFNPTQEVRELIFKPAQHRKQCEHWCVIVCLFIPFNFF